MSNHSIHVSLYGEILLLPVTGAGLILELEDNPDWGDNEGRYELDADEAKALRDALIELYPLERSTKAGTVSVKVTPDFSDFPAAVFSREGLKGIVREEVQALAESALDYAVKPAARQALANLAGAAELAREE